ncbi:alpha/beta fold hydrolase [Mucilaginibacter sp. E4BP6]|uniref:alpha/beta fold hydrolase n=1 Tax=Mucilaginibacter sp. E4BP6 TaxID=2723089 RepID=UPI0015CA78C5|nr:alpha/beta hydrolase [Mucilaginibacter sp. E4BP6]NYE68401.1 pimeloyl-ACP methyl ester carboxylesterase [Mucilaginibacter sp. E4BP6]
MKSHHLLSFLIALNIFSGYNCSAQNSSPLTTVAIDSTNYGQNDKAGKYYNIRGFKMYVEQYGTGVPLLLIHGNGGSINSFKNQIPFFAGKYRVIIADSRAQGRSVDLTDSLSYEMMTDDYAALLSILKIDSANVIGWSDGGIIGLMLAMKYPEKVKKLAVSGANLWPDTSAINPDVLQLVRPDYLRLLSNNHKTSEEKNSEKLLRLLFEEPNIQVDSLSRIQCPTLVIGGDHDIIKEKHLMLISNHIARSYLWIVPGSGHSVPVVFKDFFNNVTYSFFTKDYRTITGDKRFN